MLNDPDVARGPLGEILDKSARAVDEIVGPHYQFVLLVYPKQRGKIVSPQGTVPVQVSYVSNAPREDAMTIVREFNRRQLQ